MKRSGKRRRSGALEPLGFVLRRDTDLRVPATIETSPIAARDWEAAVGTRIAARAQPISLERGVLLIRTATATWSQELSLLADAIIAQLRGRSTPVDSLRFRVGKVEAPERPPARDEVRSAPPEVPLPPSLRLEVERVADVELREAIARAAAKNLGWQAMNDAQSARMAEVAARRAPPPAERPRPPKKIATRTEEESERVPERAARPTAPERAARPTGTERAAPEATSGPPGARGPRGAGSRTSGPGPATTPSPAGRRGRP